jgi:hypothetical protein
MAVSAAATVEVGLESEPVNPPRLCHVALVVPIVLAAGCLGRLGKITTEQALVEDAFRACRAQGPSTTLESVERDGRFRVVGREGDAQRVHDCMVRYAEPPKREPTAPPTAAAPATAAPAGLVASRLPGTWRGTLTLPPRAAGQVETATPATVRFVVAAGTLRWTLTAGAAPAVAADGTAAVVDGELRMTGTVRDPSARGGPPAPGRPGTTVRYAGTLVGDRLEVTGVTADKQVHVLSIRRVAE